MYGRSIDFPLPRLYSGGLTFGALSVFPLHFPYEIATIFCEDKIETPAVYFARQGRGV